MWRKGIPLYCCFIPPCCLLLLLAVLVPQESRALSFGRSKTTTRFGLPAADHMIPRYDHRKPSNRVVCDCQCGRVRLSVPYEHVRVDDPPPPVEQKKQATYHAVVDCHCPKCRKYHVADRATYLLVPADKVEIKQMSVPGAEDSSSSSSDSTFLKSFADSCFHLGPVVRYQCAHCRTKLATQPQEGEEGWPHGSNDYFLNLGAVRDDSLPLKWTKQWRAFRFPWQYANQCVWTRATAGRDDESSDNDDDGEDEEGDDDDEDDEDATRNPYFITGGCACGTYRYQAEYPSVQSASAELQHCYCQLCRRLSGGPFQTWMPVRRTRFSWLPPVDASNVAPRSSHEPPLHRYTSHGRRHVCEHCGGVLTILYDVDGDEVVWPAAGGLDDSSLPKTKEEMSKHLYGVCHICCRFRQAWYALPNDGHERIADAC